MADVRFLDSILHGEASSTGGGDSAVASDEALDAYSRVVTQVAERLIPSVANLRLARGSSRGPLAEGGGSGVVITPDGFILTSAHVVTGRWRGSASFVDGREFDIEFWQKLGPARIFEAAWDLVVTAAAVRGIHEDQLRLQRSVEAFQRL